MNASRTRPERATSVPEGRPRPLYACHLTSMRAEAHTAGLCSGPLSAPHSAGFLPSFSVSKSLNQALTAPSED